VLQVDDRRAPHFTPDHRYFIRIGSTKREADGSEIAALFARSRSFEDMPLIDSDIADLDEALVWSYARDLEGELFHEPAGFPTASVLADLHLAVDYGAILTPTLAGFLLLGRNEAVESVVAQNKLTLVRFSGRDANAPVVEEMEVRGNLTRIFDRALSFIRRYADLWDARPQRSSHTAPVPARANYPRASVVEAMTNMLSHRDYAMVEPSSRVSVFDDRIEFINPSRENLTKKSIEMGAISRLNPRLHHTLTRAEYGLESAPRGIPALRRAHFAFARREPRITTLGDEFRLELYGI
jgi:ATP-dependent DNA helicase RecG